MQMGVGEKQDIASGPHPVPSSEMTTSHATHTHGFAPRWDGNLVVVEETSIGCVNTLTSDLMMGYHSGVNMVVRRCGSVGYW